MSDDFLVLTVGGEGEIIKRLKLLKTEVRKEVRRLTEQAAMIVEAEAKARCPVRTGTLRRSIHTAFVSESPARVAFKVGAHADYAFWVEHGTRRMRAQPFLFPAARAKAERCQAFMTEGLRVLLGAEG